MLNWIALWVGIWLFSLGGPLQNDQLRSPFRCRTTSRRARSSPCSGADPVLQGLHIGIFIALAAVVVFWVLLNRSTIV